MLITMEVRIFFLLGIMVYLPTGAKGGKNDGLEMFISQMWTLLMSIMQASEETS